jgi:hypothetical protein
MMDEGRRQPLLTTSTSHVDNDDGDINKQLWKNTYVIGAISYKARPAT